MDLLKLLQTRSPLTIAEFMSVLSMHREHGYYSNAFVCNDFITLPEISSIFGELLGLFLYSLWLEHFYERDICIIEMGGGNGTLSLQLLRVFEQLPIYNHISFKIVELSDFLTQAQKAKLEFYEKKIIWAKDIGLIEINTPVFFIANEFFDCLPMHQFCYKNNALQEILVKINEINAEFCLTKKLSNCALLLNKNLEDEFITEISPAAISIARYMNEILKNFGGISLIIDYGYFQASGQSSLHAIFEHKHCGIFENFGLADISYHVDFARVIQEFKNSKNQLLSQNEFLEILRVYDLRYLLNEKIIKLYNSMEKFFKVLYSTTFCT